VIDHLGQLRKQAAVIGVYGKPQGRGAHDTLASGTNIDVANTSKGIQTMVEGKTEVDQGKVIRDDMETLPQGRMAESLSRQHAQSAFKSGADVATAILNVTNALTTLAVAIKGYGNSVPEPRAGGKRGP
jgi:hypothetical protein